MDINRRLFLGRSGLGFGSLALSAMLQGAERGVNGLSQRRAQGEKRDLALHARWGEPHGELRPETGPQRTGGQVHRRHKAFNYVQDPERLRKVRVVVVNDANGQQRNKLYPLQVGYKKYGASGIEVSDWFPHIGGCIDDIAVIRSMWTTDDNHGAQVQFHSGRHMLDPRVPTIGAWVNWGLGTLNENLPQFIGMGPRFFDRSDGHYLGPAYDEVKLKIDPRNPLDYAKPQGDITAEEQRLGFGLVNRLNRLSLEPLSGRCRSWTPASSPTNWPTACRPQCRAWWISRRRPRPPGNSTASTRMRRAPSASNCWRPGVSWSAACASSRSCTVAARRVPGTQHSNLKSGHTKLAMQVDRPIAGLLKDLKSRGLLDETLVVFATEFGRTPGSQSSNGRDHHPYTFSVWMAGGGIKGGVTHGATDDIGSTPQKIRTTSLTCTRPYSTNSVSTLTQWKLRATSASKRISVNLSKILSPDMK